MWERPNLAPAGRRALGFAVVLAAGIGCDHATKQIAVDTLSGGAALNVASDLVRFELASNPGAFMSLGASLPEWVRMWLFMVLAPLGLAAVVIASLRAGLVSNRTALLGLALLAGGGSANWLDRLLHGGAVTDFVRVGIGPLRSGVFNLADVLVVIGAGILLWAARHPAGGRDGAASSIQTGPNAPPPAIGSG